MKTGQLSLFGLPPTEGTTLTFKPLRHPVWTENKARLISRYLYYFVLITKHGTYIDGFAGPQQPELHESWAARLVLEIEPRWLRSFFLCDRDPQKFHALVELRDKQPKDPPPRSIELYCGNFNEVVNQVLQSEQTGPRVATFCLLDQRTFECEWRTVETLARHKSGHKIEQFYFLPTGWIDRAFSGLQDFSIAERWWGRSDWKSLQGLPGAKRADIFCRRFKEDLGYSFANAWPIFDQHGGQRVMYHMIHATDHRSAPHLMARAYSQATGRLEPPEQLKFEFEQWRASHHC